MIDHLGLTNIRLNFDVNVNNAVILKTRLYDQYVQSWKRQLIIAVSLLTIVDLRRNLYMKTTLTL